MNANRSLLEPGAKLGQINVFDYTGRTKAGYTEPSMGDSI